MASFRSDLDALILGVLGQQGRMHGYEISRKIDVGSEGAVPIREGQLYPILHRMENDGLIEAQWLPQEGKPARKVYALTERGRGELIAKRAAWERFAAGIVSLLGEPGTEVSHG